MSILSRYASPLKMSREVHNALQVTQGHNQICKRRRAEEEGGKPCGTEMQSKYRFEEYKREGRINVTPLRSSSRELLWFLRSR